MGGEIQHLVVYKAYLVVHRAKFEALAFFFNTKLLNFNKTLGFI